MSGNKKAQVKSSFVKFPDSPKNIKPQSLPNNQNGLGQNFVMELLGQQQAYRKKKTKQNLTQLIELYRKLVQFYSQKNDLMSMYFMEKIANLSAQIPNLQEQTERLTMSMVSELQNQQQSPQSKRFKDNKQQLLTPPQKYDPQMKKKQRSKNAQIAIQVSKVKKRANARSILNSYYQQCLQNNNLVTQDLNEQRKQLQQKLQAIHKRSIESKKQFKQIAS